MQFEKYTDRTRGLIQAAQTLAQTSGHQQFTPEHVVKTLLDDPEGLCANLIRQSGGRPDQALDGVNAALAKLPKVEGAGAGQLHLSNDTARLFQSAEELAEKAGDDYVTVERMLLAATLALGTPSGQALKAADVTAQTLNSAINDIRKGRSADSAGAEDTYEALKKYARDLTEAAQTASSTR